MTYDHLSPRSRVVAGQGVAERIAYLNDLPYFPVKPLDQVETWLKDAISAHVGRPLKPITFLLTPSGMGTGTMINRVQPFKASDSALTSFLEAFLKWCPLRHTSDLCDDHSLRKVLVRRTNGTTRNMLDVLTRLGAFAIYSAEERITYDLWRDYFSRAEYD